MVVSTPSPIGFGCLFCPAGFCLVAQSDVYDFGSSWGVQSEQLGSGSGCFGSVGILLLELVVWKERFFFFFHCFYAGLQF